MQYNFHIYGVPVFSRVLPSGDLAIWHPYNSHVREIVEPICRQRGYWRPGHNNWIVFQQFREIVLAELRSAGDHYA